MHIRADLGIGTEIAFHIIFSFHAGNAEIHGKRKFSHAVNEAEIDRFGTLTQIDRHLILGNAEDLHRRGAMDVIAGAKRFDHRVIL